MNLNKIPENLDDGVEILKSQLNAKDLEYIKDPKNGPGNVHFFFGMELRNKWKLWRQTTPLVKWFKKTYKIDHADDISGIIIDCLWNDINKKPRQDKELAKKFIEHWKKYGK